MVSTLIPVDLFHGFIEIQSSFTYPKQREMYPRLPCLTRGNERVDGGWVKRLWNLPPSSEIKVDSLTPHSSTTHQLPLAATHSSTIHHLDFPRCLASILCRPALGSLSRCPFRSVVSFRQVSPVFTWSALGANTFLRILM